MSRPKIRVKHGKDFIHGLALFSVALAVITYFAVRIQGKGEVLFWSFVPFAAALSLFPAVCQFFRRERSRNRSVR